VQKILRRADPAMALSVPDRLLRTKRRNQDQDEEEDAEAAEQQRRQQLGRAAAATALGHGGIVKPVTLALASADLPVLLSPLETWKKGALKKVYNLFNKHAIKRILFVALVEEIHAAESLESSIVRSLNAFDDEGEEGEAATVCLLKATYANRAGLVWNSQEY
jgi:hypothetical protein